MPDAGRGATSTGPAPGITFAGVHCETRAALAAAIAGQWRAAVAHMGSAQKKQELLDLIATTFGGDGLDEMEAAWAAHPPGVDRAIADLLVTLDPTGAPVVVCGFTADRGSLRDLAGSVATGGDTGANAARAVGAMYAQGCLLPFIRLPGHEDLADVDRHWRAAVDAFQGYVAAARSAGATLAISDANVQAQLLAAVADEEYARTVAASRTWVRAGDQEWYGPLADPPRATMVRSWPPSCWPTRPPGWPARRPRPRSGPASSGWRTRSPRCAPGWFLADPGQPARGRRPGRCPLPPGGADRGRHRGTASWTSGCRPFSSGPIGGGCGRPWRWAPSSPGAQSPALPARRSSGWARRSARRPRRRSRRWPCSACGGLSGLRRRRAEATPSAAALVGGGRQRRHRRHARRPVGQPHVRPLPRAVRRLAELGVQSWYVAKLADGARTGPADGAARHLPLARPGR